MSRCWLAPFALLLSAVFSFAEALPLQSPADRNQARQQQERVLQEQRQRLQELQQLPGTLPSAPAQAPVDERCIEVRSIRLLGASLIDVPARVRLLAPYQGRCLGVAQLNELLKSVTQFYLDRGYVTSRAYLPEQDLSDGELDIQVVEGRFEGFDSSSIASDLELAMIAPSQAGELLNLRALEQAVDQLGRLPSRPAQLELVPGSELGGSRVQLKGEPLTPWRVGLNRHNDGEQSTGEQQWGASLEWDSPLGLADQLVLRGGGDTVSDHWRHSADQSLYYSLPYGWWTFSYSYSQSYYRTLNETNDFAFETDGESKSQQFRGERVLHRDSLSKTAASLGVSQVHTRNYIEDSLIDVSSQRLSESQLGFNHGRRIGNAFVNLDLGWQQGIGGWDAQREGDAHGRQPVARYNKYSLTFSYLQPFQLWGESFSFDSLINGQRSEDVLYSPQRISVGGLSSVRGFKEQSLSGDSGGYWRNQLRWRRPIAWEPLRPYLQEYGLAYSYDAGVIHGDRHNPELHGRLSGHGLEFSTRGQHVAASLTLARSLERPDILTEREHPLYFRVDLFF